MGLFNIFKNKKPKPDRDFKDYADKAIAEFQENDFLGKAAEAGHKAKAAVEAKQYDEAWRFYHEQSLYICSMRIDLALRLGRPLP